ncbi:MAG: DUF488 family protein [Chloroflexota bacterium]|nr:DUF488 domain-containing protein [Chloroflexota bacterium]MBI5701957.1 DUF488 domain-containing protein [Chloroflexota bacterium]
MATAISHPIPIFTIGYGNRNFDEFVELLKKYQISYLIDIRSSPYSKYNPDFTKNTLDTNLTKHNIRYVYMGDTLGGRPNLPSCYTDGRVDYQKLREKDFYKQGINRLQTAWKQKLRVVLFCSETKPEECHRSKLVGESLVALGIEVVHIDEKGELKIHSKVISELTNGQLSFFGTPTSLTKSRKKYRQGEVPNDKS